MTDYTAQYVILRRKTGDSFPYLAPDESTLDRTLSRKGQPMGSPPLVFTNAWKERNRAERVKEVVTPVLFHGNDLVVSTPIREALLNLHLPNVALHPAIYIGDNDTWHEDYWYVTFTELFDCWDRALSDASKNFVESDGERRYDVYEYVLDEKLLDKTPLEQRLLFQMGGTINAFVFCHQSIAGLFRREAPNGADLTPAADY